MLHKSSDIGDETEPLPIISICVVTDKFKCPPGFSAIAKTFDDSSDADLWKDGFGFGIFNRVVRYICINRQVPDTHGIEVVTDLAIITEKEAVPSNFVCIDFTADTKERALKKKYLCARFTPRNDTLDAVSNIIILAKSKKPPKGYISAGDVDGMLICYKVSTIPESYGRLRHSQSTDFRETAASGSAAAVSTPLYPNVQDANGYRHSTSDLDKLRSNVDAFTIRSPLADGARGIDGVPFQLSPRYAGSLNNQNKTAASSFPTIPELKITEHYSYNFNLERSIVA